MRKLIWNDDDEAECSCGGEIEHTRAEGFSLTRETDGTITANPKTFAENSEIKTCCVECGQVFDDVPVNEYGI